jgi:hypothetical protein
MLSIYLSFKGSDRYSIDSLYKSRVQLYQLELHVCIDKKVERLQVHIKSGCQGRKPQCSFCVFYGSHFPNYSEYAQYCTVLVHVHVVVLSKPVFSKNLNSKITVRHDAYCTLLVFCYLYYYY